MCIEEEDPQILSGADLSHANLEGYEWVPKGLNSEQVNCNWMLSTWIGYHDQSIPGICLPIYGEALKTGWQHRVQPPW